MKEILEIVTSLGTLLAAFATFLTVREMSRQRKEAKQPKLVAMENILLIHKGFGFFPKVENYHDYRKPVELKVNPSILLRIVNIGLGPAIDIRWRFMVSVQSLIEVIRTKNAKYEGSYEIDEYSKQEILNTGTGFHSITLQNEGKVEFLAAESEKNELYIEVPGYLLAIFEELVAIQLFDKLETPFQLELKFKDVLGKEETHFHELRFRMISFERSHNTGKSQGFHGILCIEELRKHKKIGKRDSRKMRSRTF